MKEEPVDVVTRALNKIETTFPDIPETGDELAARWANRDAEYAKTRVPMDEEQAAVIRMTRMQEAGRLVNYRERGRLYARAKSWMPPVHADFGSMHDWLGDR